ncbi:MAG: shikimate kinase [Agathobacter sp.]|nr:shikimate kinase [Agathobacter sp.]
MEVNKNIFLIGFMGCGKSTMARLLTEEMGAELIEMDETIEAEAGLSINEIFEKYGENHFRDLESELVLRITEKGGAVVSCGGGAILRPENVENMKKNGQIIYLSAQPETIYQRVRHSTTRPLLNGNMNVEYISSLMEKRLPRYLAAADKIITVDGKEKREVLEEILLTIC